MSQRFTQRRRQQQKQVSFGFTLIELLVVIAIIALLAAILFPVFAQAREKARETTCISNLRQIGMAVRMYVQDADEAFPVFHMYNTMPAPGQTGHKGVEDQVLMYSKNKEIFRCPDDSGSPAQEADAKAAGLKADDYWHTYGSSYRFTSACFTLVLGPNGSYQNNAPLDPTYYTAQTVTDAAFQYPAETRLMRDEELPWFGCDKDPNGGKYGYCGDYYRQWHPRGGGFVYADGHAKFAVSAGAFDTMRTKPDGCQSKDCYYGAD